MDLQRYFCRIGNSHSSNKYKAAKDVEKFSNNEYVLWRTCPEGSYYGTQSTVSAYWFISESFLHFKVSWVLKI
jgi:hypothetical protein